jgi:hypothetical protein
LQGIRVELPYYFQIRTAKKAYIDKVKKGQKGQFPTFFFDEFSSDKIFKTAETYRKQFESIFKRLENEPAFLQSFLWRGISFFYPLYTYWKSLFTSFIVEECISSLLIAKRIIKETNPSAVFVLYEAGQYSRAMIIEAHRAGIPSVGLQHGFIFKEHEYYLEKNQSAAPNLSEGFYGYIAPQKTLVYGQYYRDILTKVGEYPTSSILVVGDWRYTNICLEDLKKQVDILRQEWFPSPKKIITFLTSGVSNKQYTQRIIQKFPHHQFAILVKLHPEDTENEFYHRQFTDYHFDVHIENSRLHACILMADIVIVPLESTVVINALL